MSRNIDYGRARVATLCYCILNSTLVVAYVIEYLTRHRDLMYVLMYIVFATLINIVTCNTYKRLKDSKDVVRIKYYIAITFMVFYACMTVLSYMHLTFLYVYPVLIILTVFDDPKLVYRVTTVAAITNAFSAGVRIVRHLEVLDREYLTNVEIQLITIALCSIFAVLVSRVQKTDSEHTRQLEYTLQHDPLTGVYNRYWLNIQLKKINNLKDACVSLAVIDIDFFKQINDTYGHIVGDRVLQHIANKMSNYCESMDKTDVVRIGGDEFIIFSYTNTVQQLLVLCTEMSNDVCDDELILDAGTITPSISIGIANSLKDDCISYDQLYTYADAALYTVKHAGKGAVAVYNKE